MKTPAQPFLRLVERAAKRPDRKGEHSGTLDARAAPIDRGKLTLLVVH